MMDRIEASALKMHLKGRRGKLRVHKNRASMDAMQILGEWDRILRPDIAKKIRSEPLDPKILMKEYLDQRKIRENNIHRMANRFGLPIEKNYKSLSKFNEFLSRNVTSNKNRDDIDFGWIFFIWDYSLYLGDSIIDICASKRKLRWCVKDISIRLVGEEARYVYEICGFQSKSAIVRPENMLIDVARMSLKIDPATQKNENNTDLIFGRFEKMARYSEYLCE